MKSVTEWLNELGLEQYAPAFQENAIEADTLPKLTDADLRELGVTILGHRKKLLAAIETRRAHATPASDERTSPVAGAPPTPLPLSLERLPSLFALPLQEVATETHPVLKLWAMCDSLEMLVRFLAISLLAEQPRTGEQRLPEKLVRGIGKLVEAPTLGAWFSIVQKLIDHAPPTSFLTPFLGPLVEKGLKPLLYGPKKPGTEESSFLKLRNRLAHGGGMTRRDGERLLTLWKPHFLEFLKCCAVLENLTLLGKSPAGQWFDLSGPSAGKPLAETPAQPPHLDATQSKSGSLWVRHGEQWLCLYPLAIFNQVVVRSVGNERRSSAEHAQVYSRSETVHLALTPLLAEGFAHGESGKEEWDTFVRLFSLPTGQRKFHIQGFEEDFFKNSREMVGRAHESEVLLKAVCSAPQGLWWVSGPPGMGKSFLMARLFVNLVEDNSRDGQPPHQVLPYRFRASDAARCNRAAFATFLQERLEDAGFLRTQIAGGKPAECIKRCLEAIKRDHSLTLLLDGLDEIARTDSDFVTEIPAALAYPGVRWVLAGRPEQPIEAALRAVGARTVFAEGLPPMGESDIRAMILEKIGPLRKKLVGHDRENGDQVVNPFIRLVTQRAQGLPLYVKYVVGDVLNGKYRVLDGQEDLPESLHAYHEEMLRRLSIGDLQALLTPLVATLALAQEPLSTPELADILRFRKLLQQGAAGETLLDQALGAVQSLLKQAPDPEGEIGYTLYHTSFIDHVRTSPTVASAVALAREALADMAEQATPPASLENYFLRCGIGHLLEAQRKQAATKKLLKLEHIFRMKACGVAPLRIFNYWAELDLNEAIQGYAQAINTILVNSNSVDTTLTAIKDLMGCFLASGRDRFLFELGMLVMGLNLSQEQRQTIFTFSLASLDKFDLPDLDWSSTVDPRIIACILNQYLGENEKVPNVFLKASSGADKRLQDYLEKLKLGGKPASLLERFGERGSVLENRAIKCILKAKNYHSSQTSDENKTILENEINEYLEAADYPDSLTLHAAAFILNPEKYKKVLTDFINTIGKEYYYWDAKQIDATAACLYDLGYVEEAVAVANCTGSLENCPAFVIAFSENRIERISRYFFVQSLLATFKLHLPVETENRAILKSQPDKSFFERREILLKKEYEFSSMLPEELSHLALEAWPDEPHFSENVFKEALNLVNMVEDNYSLRTVSRIARASNKCGFSKIVSDALEKCILHLSSTENAIDASEGWAQLISEFPEITAFASFSDAWNDYLQKLLATLSAITTEHSEETKWHSHRFDDIFQLAAEVEQVGLSIDAEKIFRATPGLPSHIHHICSKLLSTLPALLLDRINNYPPNDLQAFHLLLELAKSGYKPIAFNSLLELNKRVIQYPEQFSGSAYWVFRSLVAHKLFAEAEAILPLVEYPETAKCELLEANGKGTLQDILNLGYAIGEMKDPHDRSIATDSLCRLFQSVVAKVSLTESWDEILSILKLKALGIDHKSSILQKIRELPTFTEEQNEQLVAMAQSLNLPVSILHRLTNIKKPEK